MSTRDFIAQEMAWAAAFDDQYQEYLRQSGKTAEECSQGNYHANCLLYEFQLLVSKQTELEKLEHRYTLPQLRNIVRAINHPPRTPWRYISIYWESLSRKFDRHFGWFFTNGNKLPRGVPRMRNPPPPPVKFLNKSYDTN